MADASPSAGASQNAAPAAEKAWPELRKILHDKIQLEQIVKMHREFPKYADWIAKWSDEQSPWTWQLVDKPFFAGEHGCSVDDLRRIYTEEKAKFFARRAKNIGRNRTAKHVNAALSTPPPGKSELFWV